MWGLTGLCTEDPTGRDSGRGAGDWRIGFQGQMIRKKLGAVPCHTCSLTPFAHACPHPAPQLFDRAQCSGLALNVSLWPLVLCVCVLVAGRQADRNVAWPSYEQVSVAACMDTPEWSHLPGHTCLVTLAWSHLYGQACLVRPVGGGVSPALLASGHTLPSACG